MSKPVNLRRIRRTNYVLALIGLNVAYMAAIWFLSGQPNLLLAIGFRSDLNWVMQGDFNLLAAIAGTHDILMLGLMAVRLRDAEYAGMWALLIVPIAFAIPVAALIAVAGLIFIPGTIGPNRFGPDPRGWQSKAHYDEEQDRLKSGNI